MTWADEPASPEDRPAPEALDELTRAPPVDNQKPRNEPTTDMQPLAAVAHAKAGLESSSARVVSGVHGMKGKEEGEIARRHPLTRR